MQQTTNKVETEALNLLYELKNLNSSKSYKIWEAKVFKLNKELINLDVQKNKVIENYYSNIIDYFLKLKKTNDASKLINKARKIFPESLDILYFETYPHTLNGNYHSCLDLFDKLLKAHLENLFESYQYEINTKIKNVTYLKYLKAIIYNKIGETDNFINIVNELKLSKTSKDISISDENNSDTYYIQGKKALNLGNYEQAIKHFEKANLIQKKYIKKILFISSNLEENNSIESHYLSSLIKNTKYKSPCHSLALISLGDCYSKLNDFEKARNYYSSALVNKMTSSPEKIRNLYNLFKMTMDLNLDGDIVELGCFEGKSTILFRKILNNYKSKEIHVYDSFEGLPEKIDEDGSTNFNRGDLSTPVKKLKNNFAFYQEDPPFIHKGWFKDTLPHDLPKKICFAYLDSDFYDSIMESLNSVYPRMVKNGIVVIDDYEEKDSYENEPIFPGVKKACYDFLKDKKEQIIKDRGLPYFFIKQ